MKWMCTLSLVKDHVLLCAFEYRGNYQSLWSSGSQTGPGVAEPSGLSEAASWRQCAFKYFLDVQ